MNTDIIPLTNCPYCPPGLNAVGVSVEAAAKYRIRREHDALDSQQLFRLLRAQYDNVTCSHLCHLRLDIEWSEPPADESWKVGGSWLHPVVPVFDPEDESGELLYSVCGIEMSRVGTTITRFIPCVQQRSDSAGGRCMDHDEIRCDVESFAIFVKDFDQLAQELEHVPGRCDADPFLDDLFSEVTEEELADMEFALDKAAERPRNHRRPVQRRRPCKTEIARGTGTQILTKSEDLKLTLAVISGIGSGEDGHVLEGDIARLRAWASSVRRRQSLLDLALRGDVAPTGWRDGEPVFAQTHYLLPPNCLKLISDVRALLEQADFDESNDGP